MKRIAIILFFLVPRPGQADARPGGHVPDKETAAQIAEAVLKPIFGKAKIESERPFDARLQDGVWTVRGTLRCPDGKGVVCLGGVAKVRISEADARILSVSHGE